MEDRLASPGATNSTGIQGRVRRGEGRLGIAPLPEPGPAPGEQTSSASVSRFVLDCMKINFGCE